MAAVRTRPYRRILTSALHRRFVHASALSLLVCYLVAILIGNKSSWLWLWFPIGTCGIRTAMLFLSCLTVFVLRVSQMHIGSRTSASSFGIFKQFTFFQIAQTFGWYIFSAWWFTQIYIWSSSAGNDLQLVKRGRVPERVTMNERPIYLHFYHFTLACVQAAWHLYSDYDRVPLPIADRSSRTDDQRIHPVQQTSKYLQRTWMQILQDGGIRSTFVAGATVPVYLVFFRQTVWSWFFAFARTYADFPRSAADVRGFFPPDPITTFLRTVYTGALLVILWETTNLSFSVFIGKEPLKRGQPLTTDAKDPNGSLLNGLNAKKEIVRTFALWELGLISQRNPERRKTIFSELDREKGSTWSQVLVSLTDVIKGVTVRIEQSTKPAPVARASPQAKPSDPVLQTLPRLTEPLKDQNVFSAVPKATSRQDKFGDAFSSTAKSFGQSEDWTPTARARMRDAFSQASSAVLSPERKQRLLGSSEKIKLLTGGPSTTHKPEDINQLLAQFLRSPIGRPFQQTYAKRLSSIVLGAPVSSLSPIVDAVESLTRLLTASLAEDPYGKVQADIPPTVRLLTDTILTLDAFIHQGGLDAHWTDVDFPSSSEPTAQAKARQVPEVELVLDTLRGSLKDLLAAFKPYLRDIGVVGKDLRLAKEAAAIDAEDSL
ncbi:hypothetical protein N7499_012674 [Penicillium canescens]|nr:hypothetical protein N7499_012674 [Penicillium canescens]KAJ6154510.1 hypothetical protein N7485_012879 [Penicillium canescens]